MVKNIRRIENKTSRTAEMTCVTRAASYFEKNKFYKSDDYIAPRLVPGIASQMMQINFIRRIFTKKISPKGIYEYAIARTKYFDSIFSKSLRNEFEQILIFGAGFDSRGIRFFSDDSVIKVFELDAPITQNAKIRQLKKRNIKIPPNIVFVPVDFNIEFSKDKLIDYGFTINKKTVFILEGLLMYLTEQAVDLTFQMIDEFSATNSEIVFDFVYSSVLKEEGKYFGEKEIYKYVSKVGEGWTFGLEKKQIEQFLNKYHFIIQEIIDTDKLEKEYFTDSDGTLVAKLNGTHCIVNAIKK
ncbi:MAG: SAM-dependent methyltransferase [Prolixibacteraceae bacterium]|nr:SAM-dependent methyltransferase [Prolixibacteraceae bacterium]